ncbi:hypothetical protein Droror1_Dr00006154 [Drosera rotundifolia]
MFKGSAKWKKNPLKTVFMFPDILFCTFFKLNALIWEEKSSGVVPFGAMLALVTLRFGISAPLESSGLSSSPKSSTSTVSSREFINHSPPPSLLKLGDAPISFSFSFSLRAQLGLRGRREESEERLSKFIGGLGYERSPGLECELGVRGPRNWVVAICGVLGIRVRRSISFELSCARRRAANVTGCGVFVSCGVFRDRSCSCDVDAKRGSRFGFVVSSPLGRFCEDLGQLKGGDPALFFVPNLSLEFVNKF